MKNYDTIEDVIENYVKDKSNIVENYHSSYYYYKWFTFRGVKTLGMVNTFNNSFRLRMNPTTDSDYEVYYQLQREYGRLYDITLS